MFNEQYLKADYANTILLIAEDLTLLGIRFQDSHVHNYIYLYIYRYVISIEHMYAHVYVCTAIEFSHTSVRCPIDHCLMVGGSKPSSFLLPQHLWTCCSLVENAFLPGHWCSLAWLLCLHACFLHSPSQNSQYTLDHLLCKLLKKIHRAIKELTSFIPVISLVPHM